VVLEHLRTYNRRRLQPLLGERLAELLDGVLAARAESAEGGIAELRALHGDFTTALERRLLLLFALRQGRAAMEASMAEGVISKEVYTSVRQELDRAWRVGIERPTLRPGGWSRR
jgi:CPA1 family monovalent cation:H+ antiporter